MSNPLRDVTSDFHATAIVLRPVLAADVETASPLARD